MPITQLNNTANVVFDGSTIVSNLVSTLLSLPPTISKAVDVLTAIIGDTVTYTVTIANIGGVEIDDLPFSDTLPAGCTYQNDTFTVNSVSETPTVTGSTLTYTIPSIAAVIGVCVIEFSVLVTG